MAEEERDPYTTGKQKLEELEDDPPKRPEDWPDDEAKYVTFGGREGTHSYDEGPEAKLGPSGLRHHEDGSVTIDGEEVDNPDDYKGEPIPGGPTDPNAPNLKGEKDNGSGNGAQKRDADDGDESEDDSDDGDD